MVGLEDPHGGGSAAPPEPTEPVVEGRRNPHDTRPVRTSPEIEASKQRSRSKRDQLRHEQRRARREEVRTKKWEQRERTLKTIADKKAALKKQKRIQEISPGTGSTEIFPTVRRKNTERNGPKFVYERPTHSRHVENKRSALAKDDALFRRVLAEIPDEDIAARRAEIKASLPQKPTEDAPTYEARITRHVEHSFRVRFLMSMIRRHAGVAREDEPVSTEVKDILYKALEQVDQHRVYTAARERYNFKPHAARVPQVRRTMERRDGERAEEFEVRTVAEAKRQYHEELRDILEKKLRRELERSGETMNDDQIQKELDTRLAENIAFDEGQRLLGKEFEKAVAYVLPSIFGEHIRVYRMDAYDDIRNGYDILVQLRDPKDPQKLLRHNGAPIEFALDVTYGMFPGKLESEHGPEKGRRITDEAYEMLRRKQSGEDGYIPGLFEVGVNAGMKHWRSLRELLSGRQSTMMYPPPERGRGKRYRRDNIPRFVLGLDWLHAFALTEDWVKNRGELRTQLKDEPLSRMILDSIMAQARAHQEVTAQALGKKENTLDLEQFDADDAVAKKRLTKAHGRLEVLLQHLAPIESDVHERVEVPKWHRRDDMMQILKRLTTLPQDSERPVEESLLGLQARAAQVENRVRGEAWDKEKTQRTEEARSRMEAFMDTAGKGQPIPVWIHDLTDADLRRFSQWLTEQGL